MTGAEGLAGLAADWWRADDDAREEADRIVLEQLQEVPALIRALAARAPEGALSYIGVTVMEDLAEAAVEAACDDTSIDLLIAAGLSPADTFEILCGPYPKYLESWGVRERFATVFSDAQLDALEDWQGRFNRRAILDGDGVRLLDVSPWFGSTSHGAQAGGDVE